MARVATLLIGATLAVCLGLGACSDLPKIETSVCGNAVTEPGEDCDSYARNPQQCRAPGQPFACRFDCSTFETGNGPRCPAGWGCGADRICRAPTGAFSPTATTIHVEARRLLLGDFDGDRRQDIIATGLSNGFGQSHFHALFLDDTSAVTATVSPDMLVATPAAADVDSDGRDDLVVNAFMGIGLLAGGADKTLAPVPYPLVNLPPGTTTRMLRVDGYRGHPLHQGVLALFSQSTFDVLVSVENFSAPIALLPFPVGRVAGQPVTARLRATSPCEDVLLADREGPGVYEVTPCTANGLWKTTAGPFDHKLSLPDGHLAAQGILVADMDDDGLLDVLIGDESNDPWIAFGCENRTFCELPPSAGPSAAGSASRLFQVVDETCLESIKADRRFPLAVGMLDGDRVPDLISPTELFLSKSLQVDTDNHRILLSGCPANQRFAGQWTIGTVADVNRDGMPDAVVGSSESLDVQVLLGTGKDRLNWTTVPTTAPVKELVIGDFDGDLVSDIAIGQSGTEGEPGVSGQSDSLAIAYGQAFGPPSAAIDVGRFRGLRQMTSALYDTSDAVDEIGVVSRSDEGDSETITVLIGSPDRRPFAAYGLHVIDGSGPSSIEYAGNPWATVTGHFTLSAPDDIVAYAVDDGCMSGYGCSARLWLIPADEAGLDRPSPSALLPTTIAPLGATEQSDPSVLLRLAAGDLDGDGTDEVIVLSPTNEGATTVWSAKPPADGLAWPPGEVVTQLSRTALSISPETAPFVADIDGDGAADLAMLMSQDDGSRVIAIAWNDGAGRVDLAGATLLSAPDGDPTAIAIVRASTNALVELAVLTETSAWLVRRSISEPREFTVTPLAEVSGGIAVAAGDVTGDGVDDLVVGSAESVRVHPGQAVQP